VTETLALAAGPVSPCFGNGLILTGIGLCNQVVSISDRCKPDPPCPSGRGVEADGFDDEPIERNGAHSKQKRAIKARYLPLGVTAGQRMSTVVRYQYPEAVLILPNRP
jgi:hypothetical protein